MPCCVLCRSRAQSFPRPVQAAPGAVGPDATEGIVPGQDFCNHGMFPNSRWTISGGPGSQVSFADPFLAAALTLTLPDQHSAAALSPRSAVLADVMAACAGMLNSW